MPPQFFERPIADLTDGLHRLREEDGPAYLDSLHLGLQALLEGLLDEVGAVRRSHVPGDELDPRFLEGGDLGGEVLLPRLEPVAVCHGVALLPQEEGDLVAEEVAVGGVVPTEIPS